MLSFSKTAQNLYVMEMDEGLTLALLLGPTGVPLGSVYVKVRSLRQELASALNRHCSRCESGLTALLSQAGPTCV